MLGISDWNPREDGRSAGGASIPFKNHDETTWLIRASWPVENTTCRLTIREYDTGDITVERGRAWVPPTEEEEEDGA